jgi:DNA-binding beta-propeller fold protein YncE
MAWDPRRSVLWYVVQEQGNDSSLYELDPATGTTKRWGLPYTDYPGWDDMIVVDATGAVWFSYRGGVMLFRFDPASGKLARHDLNLKIEPAGNSSSGETPITAIAADGDGVLIAREGLPYPFLTHVDSSMKEGEFVPLANVPLANVPLAVRPWIEVMELAVVDNRLIVGTEPGALALYSRQGERIASLPQIEGAFDGAGSLARLIPDGPDLVAVPGKDSLTLLDATGAVVSTVPLSLDLPVGQSSYDFQSAPQCLATDWHGTFWYAFGGYVVEVRSESSPPVTAPVGGDGFGGEAILALAACLSAAAAFVTLRRFVLARR